MQLAGGKYDNEKHISGMVQTPKSLAVCGYI